VGHRDQLSHPTREIGVPRALGSSRWPVRRAMVDESVQPVEALSYETTRDGPSRSVCAYWTFWEPWRAASMRLRKQKSRRYRRLFE
jgi:hypothetical protein